MAARLHPALTLAAAASLVWAAPAGSHPGHGPPTITVASLKYAPADLTIYSGDAVLWVWSGPDTNHSVTADDGSFDSDKGKPAGQIEHPVNDGYAQSFTKPGTYGFHCRVHSFMHGTITVRPSPTPIDPSATAAPAISAFHASPRGARTLLRFKLTAPADLRATVRRASGGKVLKEVDFGAPPGATRRRVSFGRLRPGRYRVTLVAVDRASGASSKPAKASFRVAR